jgi:hypothetical protein
MSAKGLFPFALNKINSFVITEALELCPLATEETQEPSFCCGMQDAA